jgi:hypothetical protein
LSTITERNIIVTLPSGETVTISDNDRAKLITTMTVTCDGPRCEAHHDQRVVLTWTGENTASDINAIPDAFARFIKAQFSPYDEKLYEFCSPRCLQDYVDYQYIEPLSPHQKAMRKANNPASGGNNEPDQIAA